jgi:hypothetical protein
MKRPGRVASEKAQFFISLRTCHFLGAVGGAISGQPGDPAGIDTTTCLYRSLAPTGRILNQPLSAGRGQRRTTSAGEAAGSDEKGEKAGQGGTPRNRHPNRRLDLGAPHPSLTYQKNHNACDHRHVK